ncbi:MAG TPA: STAS domain-containing protein [Bryobacteraceae bacterium]|jgi:anti-sigma B factor antagonist|nr:STAS domain-containing protein [Bryobacteraceae bacterium]
MLHHKLDIQQTENEGITILTLHGKLDMGIGEIALRDFVHSLMDGGNRKLMLNLAAVSDIDGSAIGMLLLLSDEYSEAGGKLVLFNVPRAHGEVYEMARLEATIEIYRDELDATNSFFPDRAVARYDILDYVESQSNTEIQSHEDKNDKT